MAGETIGYGTKLHIAGSEVAKITNVTPPEGVVSKWAFATFDSDDATEQNLPGLIAWGDCTFDLVYTPAMSTLLYAALDRTDKSITITRPDASTHTFIGFLSKVGEGIPCKEGLTMSISITPKGTVAH